MSHHASTEYMDLLTHPDEIEDLEDGMFADAHALVRKKKKKKKFFLCDAKLLSFLFVGFITLVYTVVEIGVAVWLSSLSLLSDGFHNLSDVISLAIAFWAVQVSKTKSSDKMTFGWARSEILGALTNGVFLLSLSLYILLEAIPRYVEPEHLDAGWPFIGVAGGGVVVNTLGTLIFAVAGHSHGHSHSHGGHGHSHGGKKEKRKNKMGHGHSHAREEEEEEKEEEEKEREEEDHLHGERKHGHSHSHAEAHRHSHSKKKNKREFCFGFFSGMDMNVWAVFIHYLGDMISSLIVLAVGLLIHFGPHGKWTEYIDPSASVLIVILILYTTVPLVKRASLILMQGTPADLDISSIKADLTGVEGILDVHDLHIWQLVDGMGICSVHVAIEEGVSFTEVVRDIKAVMHLHGVHSSTIQPEFHPRHHKVVSCKANCVRECEEDWCCKNDEDEGL